MQLRLLEELLASRAGGNRSRLPELLPWLLELLLLELLGLEGWLLELLGLLESRLLGRQSRLEVGGKRVDLSILVLVPGETLQSDVFPGQLGNWHQGSTGLLRSKLLLGSKLLRVLGKLLILLELSIKLSLLLRHKLLLLRGKLLLLRSKLLLLLEGRLLLARSKLLLRLLLSELLLLLEVPEVLVEVLGVELVRGGPVGVEVGGVEHWPPGALPAAGEGLPLGGGVVLGGDPLLLLNDGLLEGEDSLVPLLLQLESWVRLNTSRWNFQLL